jgi:diguanylate cyclase (GGDEF)-like protein
MLLRTALASVLVVTVIAWTRFDALHAAVMALAVAAPLLGTVNPFAPRAVRSSATTLSLLTASAVGVHLYDGRTEAHFSFFVVVGMVALYQAWAPFLVALAVVLLHHGLGGALVPHEVFRNADSAASPWTWALIHAAFVVAASAAHVVSWAHNEQMSLHDPMTGLPNRTRLGEHLTRVIAQRGPATTVLFVDLDDFRAVNESRGHAAGDEVIQLIGQRLQQVPGVELVARMGGDEFAVVVAAEQEAAHPVAEQVLGVFEAPFDVDGRDVFVRASIGMADASTDVYATPESLLRKADIAMYLAKSSGKRRLGVFSSGMEDAVRDKVELERDLGTALDHDELELHYQSAIALADGEPYVFEALLRWNHPVRGRVSPVDFIPVAEDTGHIIEIGAWVLREACEFAVTASRELGRPVAMSVNVSPHQLAAGNLHEVVVIALGASGLPADRLVLEVTEGVLVRDLDQVRATLQGLRDLGVRVAIDDFGTGFSSLSYLRDLPADVVKIDRSFVNDLGADRDADALVASIIAMAGSLGLSVVAEGVETEQQAAVLRGLGCAYAQGFLWSRPVPGASVLALSAVRTAS